MTADTSLVDRVVRADPRAIARAITLIENEAPAAAGVLAALFPAGGRALIVGVTGPPGAGKSTLVDRLATAIRGTDRRVGIIAVDPSSPVSGGAILGATPHQLPHLSPYPILCGPPSRVRAAGGRDRDHRL